MAGYDDYGSPTFADTDPTNLAVDLTKSAAGARLVGTQAQRLALTSEQVYDGMEFRQTDGVKGIWLYNASQWFYSRHFLPEVAIFQQETANEFVSTPKRLLRVGTWSLKDPTGIISSWGDYIFFSREGVYELKAEIVLGNASDVNRTVRGWFTDGLGNSNSALRSNAIGGNRVVDSDTISFDMAKPPTKYDAGDGVSLFVESSSSTSVATARSTRMRVTVSRLGSGGGTASRPYPRRARRRRMLVGRCSR